MKRWKPGGDTPIGQDGDPQPGAGGPAFKGIDMVRDRDKLAPGMVHSAVNKRMRTGSCLKRAGNLQPGDFNPTFGAKIIGSGIFSDPNGDEQMLIACAGQTWVWILKDGKDPTKVNLNAGETFNGIVIVRFSQAFDKVLLFRAPIYSAAQHTLAWDGDKGHTFDPVDTMHLPGGGGTLIRPTYTGDPFQNRMLLYNFYFPPVNSTITTGRDEIIVTDPGDYEQYDNVFGIFRINSGQSDFIVRAWPYFKGAVVVFKHRSIHMGENLQVDPSEGSLRQLSKEIGAVAWDCITEDGVDLMFLNEPNGIYRLSEVIQDQITTAPVPVSEPIQPLIDSINWKAAPGACAKSYQDYSFFALPIYQGVPRGNNVVAVYNRVTRLWESAPDMWMDTSFAINAMHITNYNGAQTLFCVDYANSAVYAMYQLIPDEINNQRWHIKDIVETRGYNLGDSTSFNRYQRVALALATVDPEVHISAISDGWNEVKNLTPTPITKDRLKFYPHAHPDYDGTGDPNEPGREDYSTVDFTQVAEDFESLIEGPIDTLPASSGAYKDAISQESLERLPIRTNGRWVSIRVENVSGRCDLLAVGVEGIPSNMETRTAA